jgi:hypothetical protein
MLDDLRASGVKFHSLTRAIDSATPGPWHTEPPTWPLYLKHGSESNPSADPMAEIG